MISYEAKNAAMRLLQKIEGSIDPFDVALGASSSFEEDFQQIIFSLGGRRSVREMTPAGTAAYLIALLIANSDS